MLASVLIVVELTASAVQMIAMNAENRQAAAWVAAERQLTAAPAPIRVTNVAEVSTLR
jgi:hypothetical protein